MVGTVKLDLTNSKACVAFALAENALVYGIRNCELYGGLAMGAKVSSVRQNESLFVEGRVSGAVEDIAPVASRGI